MAYAIDVRRFTPSWSQSLVQIMDFRMSKWHRQLASELVRHAHA